MYPIQLCSQENFPLGTNLDVAKEDMENETLVIWNDEECDADLPFQWIRSSGGSRQTKIVWCMGFVEQNASESSLAYRHNEQRHKLRRVELLMELHLRAMGCHLPRGITVLAASRHK